MITMFNGERIDYLERAINKLKCDIEKIKKFKYYQEKEPEWDLNEMSQDRLYWRPHTKNIETMELLRLIVEHLGIDIVEIQAKKGYFELSPKKEE